MRFLDLSSWQAILVSVTVLLLVTVVGMGIRLLMMMTIQQRRERQNRQINERLKALIAAYKALGGSFTGTLTVSPLHLREQRKGEDGDEAPGAERARRIRDTVEAALADIVLFGTAPQVELAAAAMRDMAQGRAVEVGALVVSLRDHIRAVLDLDPVPAAVVIPAQGPARPAPGGGRGGRQGGPRGGGGGMGGGEAGSGAGGGAGGEAADAPPATR